MPINANVTNQQITASVGETKIDVSVSGGVGPSGSNGAAGASATVTVGTVTTGAPGSSATVTNSGTSSAAVLDFTIPAGAAGAAGAAGPAGATGATGATGPAGVVAATAPVTYDAGTQTVALSVGSGLSTSGGSLVVSYGTSAGTACQGNDARLSDARTPVSHTHSASDTTSGEFDPARLPIATANARGAVRIGSGISIDANGVISSSGGYTLPNATTTTLGGVIVGTGLGVSSGTVSVTYGTTSGTACEGGDGRLSDARTPTSHASSHQVGGSDAITNVVNSPSQITANQNDYSLPSADVVRLNANAARDVTGLAGGSSGRVVVLVNVGSSAITLKHQSASSTASNRVIVPWAADYIIDPSYSVVLVYDATDSRWRVI